MSQTVARVSVYGLLALAAAFTWLRSSVPPGPPIRVGDRLTGVLARLQPWARPGDAYYFRTRPEAFYTTLILGYVSLAGVIAAWSAYRSHRRQPGRP
jgi:hypothetical protein